MNARDRLLSVVNGNWEPYIRRSKVCHAPLGPWQIQPALVVHEVATTDFDLLRHDIHVAVYAADQGESPT
jgi:hypothetical protein